MIQITAMLTIQFYIDHFSKIWDESSDDFPIFHRKYLPFEQLQREQNLEEFQQKLKKMQSKMNVRKIRKSDPGSTFFPVFRSFLETVFDFEKEQLGIILSDQFKDVSKDFFYRARKFGPELKPESIYQGLRNVWIMNGLQLMMGLPVEITPSIFGYSMIYPYSDNLLDDPSVSDSEKKDFSDVLTSGYTEKWQFLKTTLKCSCFDWWNFLNSSIPEKNFQKYMKVCTQFRRDRPTVSNCCKIMD